MKQACGSWLVCGLQSEVRVLLQGIVNTDSRSIAVPDGFVNLIPTVSIAAFKGVSFFGAHIHSTVRCLRPAR